MLSSDSGAYQKKQVRVWLIQNDLSYRKLGERIGIAACYLHQIISGTRPLPDRLRPRLIELGFPVELIPNKRERKAA